MNKPNVSTSDKVDSEQWKESDEDKKYTNLLSKKTRYRCELTRELKSIQKRYAKEKILLMPSDDDTSLISTRDELLGNSENKDDEEYKNSENIDDEEYKEFDVKMFQYKYFLRQGILLLLWAIFTVILVLKNEHGTSTVHQISVTKEKGRSFWILEMPEMRRMSVEIGGSLLPAYYGNLSKHWASIWVEMVQTNSTLVSDKYVTFSQKISETWTVPIVSENLIDFVPEVKRSNTFNLKDVEERMIPDSVIRLQVRTNLNKAFPMSLSYDLSPIDPGDGIIYAFAILIGLYILIIFEVVHRTLAAMMASTMSIAALAAFDERPSKSELITWIDMETLLLLFSMMILVAIFSETGVFNYLAVLAYKVTNGKIWALINTLCFFTAIISSCLDNVTTVLLMTPVTIKLCEVMGLNPVPVLMSMIMYSNIGGAITPVGDPPNVIIANNKDVIEAGVTFGIFTIHMGIGLVLVMLCTHLQLRFMFRNMEDLLYTEHEIDAMQRFTASVPLVSKNKELVKKTMMKQVRKLVINSKKKTPVDNSYLLHGSYKENYQYLKKTFPIKDSILLVKCLFTFFFLGLLFTFNTTVVTNISMGWAALLAVILLLILSDIPNIEIIFARIEWTTLIFFTALFILMEALSRLGLIEWIGKRTESIILSVEKPWQLTVAILLILWVSGFASSFVDNIPLTTMMIKVITSLSQNEQLDLPLQPLVWSLALGACLGGNGTLIGSSSNVVCAGVAEQHGYRFTFMNFFRIGFPVMVGSMIVTSVYLLIAHVVLGWNY